MNIPSVTLQFEIDFAVTPSSFSFSSSELLSLFVSLHSLPTFPFLFSLLLKYPTAFLSNASSILLIAASENIPPEQFTSVKTHELPTFSQNFTIASILLSVNRLLFLKFNARKLFNARNDESRLSTNASSTSQLDTFNFFTRAFLAFLKLSANTARPFSFLNAFSFPLTFISRRCSTMFSSSFFFSSVSSVSSSA